MKSLRILLHLLVLRPLIYLFFGANIVGKENIDLTDKFVIISNHNSHLCGFR